MIEVEIEGLGYRIKLEGSNASDIIARLDDEEFELMLERIIRLCEKHGSHTKHLRSDILSFVASKATESISDRILLCMAFASTYEGQEMFNKNDIEDLLFRIRDGIPANTNALLNSLESQGMIVRHRSKKRGRLAFYLSQKGIDYVERISERQHE